MKYNGVNISSFRRTHYIVMGLLNSSSISHASKVDLIVHQLKGRNVQIVNHKENVNKLQRT